METIKDYSYGIVPVHKDENGEYLFCVIHQNAPKPYWTFPKGHKEGNESDEQTALRELTEETGITDVQLIDWSIQDAYTFEYEGAMYDKTVTYFAGIVPTVTSHIPKAFTHEIFEVRWLAFSGALDLLTYEKGKVVLRALNAHLA